MTAKDIMRLFVRSPIGSLLLVQIGDAFPEMRPGELLVVAAIVFKRQRTGYGSRYGYFQRDGSIERESCRINAAVISKISPLSKQRAYVVLAEVISQLKFEDVSPVVGTLVNKGKE
jgi:hypothetical protein